MLHSAAGNSFRLPGVNTACHSVYAVTCSTIASWTGVTDRDTLEECNGNFQNLEISVALFMSR